MFRLTLKIGICEASRFDSNWTHLLSYHKPCSLFNKKKLQPLHHCNWDVFYVYVYVARAYTLASTVGWCRYLIHMYRPMFITHLFRTKERSAPHSFRQVFHSLLFNVDAMISAVTKYNLHSTDVTRNYYNYYYYYRLSKVLTKYLNQLSNQIRFICHR